MLIFDVENDCKKKKIDFIVKIGLAFFEFDPYGSKINVFDVFKDRVTDNQTNFSY